MNKVKILIAIGSLFILALLGWIVSLLFGIKILDNISLSLVFIAMGSFCLYFKEIPLRTGGTYKSILVSNIVGALFLLMGIINLISAFLK